MSITWCLGNVFIAAGNMMMSLTGEFAQPSAPLKYQNKKQNKWKTEYAVFTIKVTATL